MASQCSSAVYEPEDDKNEKLTNYCNMVTVINKIFADFLHYHRCFTEVFGKFNKQQDVQPLHFFK